MNLKNIDSHFRFGDNWQSYAKIVDEDRIAEALKGLEKLIPADGLKAKQFLDIGCGSGLSMLAALRLGASNVKGVDIDQASVDTAHALLSHHAPGEQWQVEQASIFDLDPECFGLFDVVYSWGVLHHTGDMWSAISKAGALVKGNGVFIIALYHRTPSCNLWRIEKKFYAHTGKWQQWIIRCIYKAAFIAGLLSTGRNPFKYIPGYKGSRGMNWHHDVHDWLGGYPYESTTQSEIVPSLQNIGFEVVRIFQASTTRTGIFGAGCDEYVFRRK